MTYKYNKANADSNRHCRNSIFVEALNKCCSQLSFRIFFVLDCDAITIKLLKKRVTGVNRRLIDQNIQNDLLGKCQKLHLRVKSAQAKDLKHRTPSNITCRQSIKRWNTPAASVSTRQQRDQVWKFISRQFILVWGTIVLNVIQSLLWNQIWRST